MSKLEVSLPKIDIAAVNLYENLDSKPVFGFSILHTFNHEGFVSISIVSIVSGLKLLTCFNSSRASKKECNP